VARLATIAAAGFVTFDTKFVDCCAEYVGKCLQLMIGYVGGSAEVANPGIGRPAAAVFALDCAIP